MRLRQRRESLGMKLDEAAARLKIDEIVMRSIEADDLGHLAPLYRRGYIRSYASFLGFDAADIAQMLDSIESDHPALRTVFPETVHANRTDRWLRASSYVVASLLIGTLAWQFTHEAVRFSQEGPERASQQAQDANAAGTALTPGAQGRERPSHVNASIAALEVMREQRQQARNSAGSQAWAALAEAEERDSAPAQPLADGEFTLELTASADSWVEITDAGGRQLELDLVRGGTTKQYRGLAPFSIQFGRASAISLYLDGQPVDLVPFTAGDVTRMLLHGEAGGAPAQEPDPGNS